MTGKSATLALVLGVGLLAAWTPTHAQDARVKVAYGQDLATEVSVSRNESGTGVTVVRGVPVVSAAKAAPAVPSTYIDGLQVNLESLEPTVNWFIDRSNGELVIVHCYTRPSIYVGGGRPINCNSRKL